MAAQISQNHNLHFLNRFAPKDLREGHPEMYRLGVAVTVLAAGAFIAANIVSFPLSGPISLLALGILSAVTYGIVNDQMACRQCIEYFTVGHTPMHKRLLKTDDPTKNAIVWGIHTTWILGAVAGTAMAIGAWSTGLAVSQIMPFLVPAFAIGIGATCIYSHIQAKKEEAKWNKPENQAELNMIFRQVILPFKGYHAVNLNEIPADKRAAYMGVGKRNEIGYKLMPTQGIAALVGIIVAGILL